MVMALETVVKLIMNQYCVRCSIKVVGSIPVTALACESFSHVLPTFFVSITLLSAVVVKACVVGLDAKTGNYIIASFSSSYGFSRATFLDCVEFMVMGMLVSSQPMTLFR